MSALIRCARRGSACAAGLLLAVACGGGTPPAPDASGSEYTPLYGARDPGGPEARGTIRGDFQWAAGAPTLGEAATRWEAFLQAHDPPGGEFEDGLHASYVAAARYELMRVYYLQGRRDAGDALLRRLDPVGWLK